ncbi:MAG: hypothetical protein K0S37_3008 [Microbacterium sp.]|jgi:hypothetical protein|nr:hypothetical protein [Microbacterium sp.]
MTNPARFGTPLDAALIDDVLTSATQAEKQLDNALTAYEKTPGPAGVLTRSAHTALRTFAHADPELPRDAADGDEDLADLIHALLSDYTAALTNLKALAALPTDPFVEYERLLREAEELAKRQMSSPDRAEVLAKIADRWLSDALVNAHKRRSATGGTVTHFGSPREEVVNQHELRLGGSVTFTSADAVTEYFAAYGPDTIAVVDVHGALYLLSEHEDTGTFYVGIPQAEDEHGIDVDPNRGPLRADADGKGHPAYPLTILSNGAGASYPRNPEAS